jgi:hypothetical protein
MSLKAFVTGIFLAIAVSFATAMDTPPSGAKLSAAEIVNKNIAARGGLQPWRSVQSLSMTGRMEAGGNNRITLPMPGRRTGQQMPEPRPQQQVQLPFLMELKRPRKMRVELQFNGQTALQIFDGNSGWKLRPFLNRREIEPYTAEESKAAAMQSELDGVLIDYAAKGTIVELVGMDKIDGRDTYKLRLKMKNGETTHLWIDAQTFLESKMEGSPRRLDGKYHPVEIHFLDFHTVDGLLIPYILETRIQSAATVPGTKEADTISEKIIIDKIVVNPPLDDARFSKTQLESSGNLKPSSTTTSGGQSLP